MLVVGDVSENVAAINDFIALGGKVLVLPQNKETIATSSLYNGI